MLAIVSLSVPHGLSLVVKEGQHVDIGERLTQSVQAEHQEIINIVSLLHISSQKIPQYLTKKIGDPIARGEIFAKKKSLFSSITLKSPLTGRLSEVDLKAGTLTLVRPREGEELHSPVKGKINKIGKHAVEVEFAGTVFPAGHGHGPDVTGKLLFLSEGKLDVLDVVKSVDKAIVLVHDITSGAAAKIDTLGASGLILQVNPAEVYSPYLVIEEEVFNKLTKFEGKHIYLYPEEKKIIIPEP